MPALNRRLAPWIAICLFVLGSGLSAQELESRKPANTREEHEGSLRRETEQFEESDNPFLRDQWFMHGRTLDHGDASDYRLRAYQQKLYLRALNRLRAHTADSSSTLLRPESVLPSPSWTNLGPVPLNSDYSGFGSQDYGLVSGRVSSITVDPNDATGNTVYAGSAYGGVWKTTNGTAVPGSVNWTPIMDDQPTLAVGAIAVQPGNSNVLLVGTGEPNQSGDSYYGLGILRSIDGGITWNLARQSSDTTALPFRGIGVSKIAFSTDNPSLVVAALNTVTNGGGLGAFINTNGRGIEYSTDAGATWHLGNVNDAGVPTTPVQSATDIVYSPLTHTFYAAIRYHGIYSSSDGINFTRLAAQPGAATSLNCPSATNAGTCPFYRAQIALHPTKNEIYVWFLDPSSNDQGIFQSTDGGSTWNSISTGELDSGCGDGTRCGTSAQGLYDLFLAAIPDGNATDLYAGAINIYKCQVSATNPDCKSAPAGTNWFNLTHVYSCNPLSSLAHVHPDQHGIDFVRSNPSIIYFSNDGGVYRTLNGPGLNSGSCSASLPFDNLNQHLGSITQFYTLAGHPTDPTAFVGGTQDNGTPAVSSALNGGGLNWAEVMGGDGASVAFDPTNGNNLYVSITNSVNVYLSSGGVGSHSTQFGSAIINTNSVGGDKSDWVAPFKLDPADPTKIIIGTCRVWRGASNGAGWTAANAISNNFGTGAAAVCGNTAQTTVTTIRTLAIGGPKTANGSQVIYAGTEFGHVFATTNADAGPTSWTDAAVSVIGTCNSGTYPQCGYPISGLAIDPRDATGKSVYATVMGFGVPHVLKSTDAGVTWTNMTGNLPDAPTDAIAVDPGNPAIVYVGTDIGVFATQDGGSTWTEFGTGFPNTEVVAFDIFNSGSTHLLRAATHGRGIWSTTLASAVTATGTLSASPSFLTFLNQAVGTTSTQTITVTASQAPVTISSMVPPAPPFVLGTNGCLAPAGSPPVTLQPGSSCTVGVKYTPTASGVQTSSVSFSSNATGSPLSVSLEGNAVVTTGSSVTPETGWWWDQNLNGTGFFIEFRPASAQNLNPGIFVGGFLYDNSGNSTWLVSLPFNGVGTFTSGSSGLTYAGNWLRCTGGQAINGPWKQNNCSVYAPVTINFTSSTTATMSRPDGTTINLSRFSFSSTHTPQTGSPQNGWWWIDPSNPTYNPGSGGTGYGIEIQGNAAFIVAYVYDGQSGNPVWYLTTSGATPMPSPTTYTGNWYIYSGTPHWCTSASPACTPDGSYTATQLNPTAVATTINFTDATHGTMTMNGVTIPITKFNNF